MTLKDKKLVETMGLKPGQWYTDNAATPLMLTVNDRRVEINYAGRVFYRSIETFYHKYARETDVVATNDLTPVDYEDAAEMLYNVSNQYCWRDFVQLVTFVLIVLITIAIAATA